MNSSVLTLQNPGHIRVSTEPRAIQSSRSATHLCQAEVVGVMVHNLLRRSTSMASEVDIHL